MQAVAVQFDQIFCFLAVFAAVATELSARGDQALAGWVFARFRFFHRILQEAALR
jgi:hypothetical protein